ncbi:SRPBCC family protein [Tunturibacter empetritectus]|uniref:SRPBCC family protein n=1 Tax=Tunturiibacter lichenicola TaxID=2051959 RepID=A0A7W8JAP0_9BACT|nr:SRPBCC family protein [Edaphobacter lichenicola]MBB5345493.1 hypothetical protein [Edaphobacter lichenicola]
MFNIKEITTIAAPIERCFDLSRSVEVHLLRNIHGGEQALAVGGLTSGLTNLSDQVTWRAKHFGTWQNLTNEVTAFEPPTYFQVTMTKGIFRFMQADHIFHTLPSGATEMQDLLRISAPLPILGPLAEVLFLRNYMLSLVRERNAVIKQLAESSDWQRYLPPQTEPLTQTTTAATNQPAQRQTRS